MAFKKSIGFRNAHLVTGSVQDLLANGIIHIYSGTQPTDADQAETGTLLAKITLSSGAFVSGTSTNGINFADTAAGGIVAKAVAEAWSGLGLANGAMGWFRHYANTVVTGASTTAIRYDGSITVSNGGGQLQVASTAATVDVPITISTFTYTDPA